MNTMLHRTSRQPLHRMALAMCALLGTMAFTTALGATRLEEARSAIETGNFTQAASIYRELAASGDAKAQYNLAQMHYYGDGMKQDYREAIRLYRLAAEQGLSDAQYSLGVIYFTNKVTPPNYEEAIRLYRLAAEQGHVKSQLDLGLIYLKGEVVPQDYEAAQKWLTLAAQQGNGDAQYALGNMYLHGDGVAEDLVRGYMWVALAADDKTEQHKKDTPNSLNKRQTMLRFLGARMTPEQIEQANAMAASCTARQLKEC